jgi:hypothetical protein
MFFKIFHCGDTCGIPLLRICEELEDAQRPAQRLVRHEWP